MPCLLFSVTGRNCDCNQISILKQEGKSTVVEEVEVKVENAEDVGGVKVEEEAEDEGEKEREALLTVST